MGNYTPIRNGILNHLEDRRITPLEFGVYVMLHLRADWSVGIYRGCALTLAYQFGDPDLRKQIKDTLWRLRQKRYINYSPVKGRRGAYDILIHKYEPRVGRLMGTRLNAWKNGDLAVPEYEPLASDSPEGRPIQEERSKREDKVKGVGAVAPSRAKAKRAFQMAEDFAPKDSHSKLAAELGVDLTTEFEVFKDHHLSHGSEFIDWDRALNKWLRNAKEFRRGGNGKAGLTQPPVLSFKNVDTTPPPANPKALKFLAEPERKGVADA